MPCLGLTSLHKLSETFPFIQAQIVCQCPVSGSRLCTLPLKNLSIYAGFKPCFFVYFSEFSDYLVQ